jgi:hypothetical protein
MNYWWVNHKQTLRQEFGDTPFGYDHASGTTVAKVLIHPTEALIQVSTRGSSDYHFIEPAKGEPLRRP